MSRWLAAAAGGALFVAGAWVPRAAQAHDTWLEQRATSARGTELALTTGTLFPGGETGTPAEALVDRGCRATDGRRVPLETGRAAASALTLHARGASLRECWVQTTSFEVEVAPALVPVYLREIAAPDSVRALWAEQQKQALPWRERYTKHARISLHGGGEGAPSASPSMAFDIALESPAVRLRPGDTVSFLVLRDGAPLANQAVELRGDMSRLGLWRRTDAEGRASVAVPFGGRWVLRATDLRPVPGQLGHWESRFVTHTFTVTERGGVGSAAQPNQPSWKPNARSANHQSASTAMANEPPTSTMRR